MGNATVLQQNLVLHNAAGSRGGKSGLYKKIEELAEDSKDLPELDPNGNTLGEQPIKDAIDDDR